MTFPHQATIQRNTKYGSMYEHTYHGTAQCFLQPLDAEQSQIYGITFSKGFRCYFPTGSDVIVGDRVEINSVNYSVRGLKDHNYGRLAHINTTLEKL